MGGEVDKEEPGPGRQSAVFGLDVAVGNTAGVCLLNCAEKLIGEPAFLGGGGEGARANAGGKSLVSFLAEKVDGTGAVGDPLSGQSVGRVGRRMGEEAGAGA